MVFRWRLFNTNEAVRSAKPITACIGDNLNLIRDEIQRRSNHSLEKVDWFGVPNEQERLGQQSGGKQSYVISSIGSEDKVSYGYVDCTGVIAVGIEKQTGKEISFLTHQWPGSILNSSKSAFSEDLKQTLREFSSRVRHNTIDIVIFGGNYITERNGARYKQSMKLLSKLIQKVLSIDPQVITGPNMRSLGDVDVFFATSERRLTMFRPNQSIKRNNDSGFKASTVQEQRF